MVRRPSAPTTPINISTHHTRGAPPMYRILRLVGLTLLVALPLHAQTTATGSIRGVAQDQDGAVVPGLLVSATSASVPGVYSATTDGVGQYRLENLPLGDYTVVAELNGFARFLRAPI